MYRYQRMIEEFYKMEEFKGYEMDYSIIRNIYFEFVDKEKGYYLIKITDGAFWKPKVFKLRGNDRRFVKASEEEKESLELKKIITKISTIIKRSNSNYENIIPEYVFKGEKYNIKVEMMIEAFEDYNTYPIKPPIEIKLFLKIINKKDKKEEELIFILKNVSKNDKIEEWEFQNKGGLEMKNEIKKDLETYISETESKLNKKYKIRKLLGSKNGN